MFAYCNNSPIGASDSSGTRMEDALNVEIGFWEECAARKALANTKVTVSEPDSFAPGSSEARGYYTVTARIDVTVPENVLVGLSADIYARLLYEKSVKTIEEYDVPSDAEVKLMDIEHIKWEYNVHLWGRYTIDNCNQVDFNVEESYSAMASRLWQKLWQKLQN